MFAVSPPRAGFSDGLGEQKYPTNPFTILEPRDQEIVEFYVAQERRAKVVKGIVGQKEREGEKNVLFFLDIISVK